MALDNLPQELIDAIYMYLDRRSLMMCSLTCRSLSYSAQRLYWMGSTVRITSNSKLAETYLTSRNPKNDSGNDAGNDATSTLLGIFGSGKELLGRTRDAFTAVVSDLVFKNQENMALIRNISLFSYISALDLSNLRYNIPFSLTLFPNIQSLSLKNVRIYNSKRLCQTEDRLILKSLCVRECEAVFVFDLVHRLVDLSQLDKLEICQGSNVVNHILSLCKDSLVDLHIHTAGMDNEEPFTAPRPKFPAALRSLHIQLDPKSYDSESKRAEDMYNLLQCILPNHVVRTITFTCPMATPNPRALHESTNSPRILFAQPAYDYVGDVLSKLAGDTGDGIDDIRVVYRLHPFFWDARQPVYKDLSIHTRWWTSTGPRPYSSAP